VGEKKTHEADPRRGTARRIANGGELQGKPLLPRVGTQKYGGAEPGACYLQSAKTS